MSVTTFSSREFKQDVARAKKAAQAGPVFITEGGNPSYVLMAFDDYNNIIHKKRNIVEIIAMEEDVDFEPEKLHIKTVAAEF